MGARRKGARDRPVQGASYARSCAECEARDGKPLARSCAVCEAGEAPQLRNFDVCERFARLCKRAGLKGGAPLRMEIKAICACRV